MAISTRRRPWAGCNASSSMCRRSEPTLMNQRPMKMFQRRFYFSPMRYLLLGLVLWLGLAIPAQAERIRDLASFAGVRENALVGYGLVVGLDGSGDQTTQAPFTTQ